MTTLQEFLNGTDPFLVVSGDVTEVLKGVPDNSFHCSYSDPPYGLSSQGKDDIIECLTQWLQGQSYLHKTPGFLGRNWDSFVPGPEAWKEIYRVLKPGASCVAFASTRTVDLMGISMRLAGFEIREGWSWIQAMGMPKGLNVSKAMDSLNGDERPYVGDAPIAYPDSDCWGTPNANSDGGNHLEHMSGLKGINRGGSRPVYGPGSETSAQWEGWGTTLKPSYEPLVVTRKPLEGSVVENVLKHGTGAINIDGSRIKTGDNLNGGAYADNSEGRHDGDENWRLKAQGSDAFVQPQGRYPANLALIHNEDCEIVGKKKVFTGMAVFKNTEEGSLQDSGGLKRLPHGEYGHADTDGTETIDEWDCSEGCAVKELGDQSGGTKSRVRTGGEYQPLDNSQENWRFLRSSGGFNDCGTSARFFYQAKANANDRLVYLTCSEGCEFNNSIKFVVDHKDKECRQCGFKVNAYRHPTIKPLKLANYHASILSLPKHVRPLAVVPFCGTGIEAKAMLDAGFRVLAIDLDPRHCQMTTFRLQGHTPKKSKTTKRLVESSKAKTPETPKPKSIEDLFGF